MSLKIGIASDHGGKNLKAIIKSYLIKSGYECVDYGVDENITTPVDYPDYAQKLSKALLNQEFDRGILLCGSGIGVSIAANRFKGIRAALVWNEESASLSIKHNHANIICMGERLIDPDYALKLLAIWLAEKPDLEPRHQNRIEKLDKC